MTLMLPVHMRKVVRKSHMATVVSVLNIVVTAVCGADSISDMYRHIVLSAPDLWIYSIGLHIPSHNTARLSSDVSMKHVWVAHILYAT